ncbi:siderophore iron transporter mirB [Lentithecium fluviatile CBS 122367]|uniref:Siderophore iron transporter mirB n=1 Tax=Lentithecium fluviatile CBS 122367 TaxID=1168545 RepID=A0A6G1JMG2_9PLEO|nr:siderophore iron transporter mirB [Lentithecium fluviatile CBS 122367]
MRNPFKQNSPIIEVPIVESGRYHKDTKGVINIEAIHPNSDVKHVIDSNYCSSFEKFTPDAQDGVRAMEATTIVWTRQHLIVAYILMWIVTFIDALQQGTSGALVPWVTTHFQQHSLTAYTGVMSSIIGGVLKLTLAQILNIFGRPQGFALSVAFLALGLALMAACNGVQLYAAAQIFYWLGYNGMSYTLGIFIADTSSLQNRGFMFGYVNSPYIITVWIAGPLSQYFLSGPGWRTFYIAFAIITVIAAIPVFWLFMWNYRKAVNAGIITIEKSNRTFIESIKYYAVQFDVGGLFLAMGGLVFFLLPFSLYSYQEGKWRSPLCISFWTIGVLMMVTFVLYEKYIAPVRFMPYDLFLDPTVLGANILAATVFFSFYLWNAYFSSFLQVVSGLSLRDATYVSNIYIVGSCFFSVIVGLLIKVSGRFKWIALTLGLPITALGVGLMAHFRHSSHPVVWLILCQLLIAFSGGALVITEQIAVMAATDHQYIAVVLALEGMFSAVGGGIGSSVAAAIWTGVFPVKLMEYLPVEKRGEWAGIYASLGTQLQFKKGTATRVAIERAYGDAQMAMCAAATAVLVFGFVSVLLWRDIRVCDFKQTKGRVV